MGLGTELGQINSFLGSKPMGATAGAVAAQIAGQALGGGGLPPNVSNNASRISVVNPGVVNLGEMMRPYNEGSITNGGFGVPLASRWIDSLSGGTPVNLGGELRANIPTPVIVGGAILLGLGGIWLLRRRR